MKTRTPDEEREEREANAFAMCLLMPESLVETWCAGNPKFTVQQFAKAFQVPLAAATLRLADLKIAFDMGE